MGAEAVVNYQHQLSGGGDRNSILFKHHHYGVALIPKKERIIGGFKMKLTAIIGALAASAFLCTTAAAADSISLRELYHNKTECSEVNGKQVKYDNLEIRDIAASSLTADEFYTFLIGDAKDPDYDDSLGPNTIVLYVGKGEVPEGENITSFGTYNVKGTLRCVKRITDYLLPQSSWDYEILTEEEKVFPVFYQGLRLGSIMARFLHDYPDAKYLFYVNAEELTKVVEENTVNFRSLYRDEVPCSEIPVEYGKVRIDGNPFSSVGTLNDYVYSKTDHQFMVGQNLNENKYFDKIVLFFGEDMKETELWDIEGIYHIKGTLKCEEKSDDEFYKELHFVNKTLGIVVEGFNDDNLFYIDIEEFNKIGDIYQD